MSSSASVPVVPNSLSLLLVPSKGQNQNRDLPLTWHLSLWTTLCSLLRVTLGLH